MLTIKLNISVRQAAASAGREQTRQFREACNEQTTELAPVMKCSDGLVLQVSLPRFPPRIQKAIDAQFSTTHVLRMSQPSLVALPFNNG